MRARSRVLSRQPSTDGSAWKSLAAEIRASPSPYAHPQLGRLYRIALAEGRRQLRTYHAIDEDRRDDLVLDLLLAELTPILVAARPLTFFRVALRNRARTWLRRRDARVEGGEPEEVAGGEAVEDAMIARLDGLRALAELAPRERAVLLAACLGSERGDVARAHGLSAAAVHQIVSRARKRLNAPHARRRAR
jgi:DNA-directed RNA polymerase specialized sigma24 family protein